MVSSKAVQAWRKKNPDGDDANGATGEEEEEAYEKGRNEVPMLSRHRFKNCLLYKRKQELPGEASDIF